MKKSILAVAGLAAVAGIAAPVAGVFATDPSTATIVDDLSVTISNSCTLSRAGASGTSTSTSVKGTWAAAQSGTGGTYSATAIPSQTIDMGTSTFTVACNDTTKGHYMTVAVTGLSDTNSHTIPYTNSATGTTTSGWNITTSSNTTLGTTAAIVTTSGTDTITGAIYSSASSKNTTAVTGQTFTANYLVGLSSTQAAGTYTGSATYTLTYGG